MSQQRYTRIAQTLHWLVAGLIVSQYILAKLAERAEEQNQIVMQLAILANHKSVGISILLLVVLRLLWRFTHRAPSLPSTMPAWQQKMSALMHWLLYGLIVALPISGWLMSSAKSYSVSWFNLVLLPDFIAPDKGLANQLEDIHEILGEALFVLALIHTLAAFKHLIVDRDGVMQRMASRGGTIIVLASLALVVGQLGFPQPKQSTTILQGATTSEAAVADTTVSSKRSELPPWEIDYSSSAIKFTGDQAGAPFIGQWQQWQADIQFDSNNLDDSRFDVKIDIASVASGDETRDEHIVSEDFFHQESFAYARFVARDFSATQSGFETTAELTMKGITKPALFRFSVQEEGDKRVLSGKATLDRLAWNIGVGDWSDTSWVGQQVTVDVTVTTTTATATGNK